MRVGVVIRGMRSSGEGGEGNGDHGAGFPARHMYPSLDLELDRFDPLLNAAPVHNGAGLEDLQAAAEGSALLSEAGNGRLLDNDAVDCAGGRGAGAN
jgi:hypothetical protein